jgi:hypothetical protein
MSPAMSVAAAMAAAVMVAPYFFSRLVMWELMSSLDSRPALESSWWCRRR